MEQKNRCKGGLDLSRWLLAAAVLLGILALVLYLLYGRTAFDPNYSWYAIGGLGAGIVCGLVGVIGRLRLFAFLAYLAFLFGFLHDIVSQINLIANILYGVDGSTFSPAFFIMLTAALLALVLSLVSGILMKNRRGAVRS